MRMLWVLLACTACARNQPTEPSKLAVEEVALWFVRAAMAGDEVRASSLALRYDEAAPIANAADRASWDAAVRDTIEQLAREGEEARGEVVSARVVERRRLEPGRDGKLHAAIDVAIVELAVRAPDGRTHASPQPWMFVKTAGGWKFSPER